MARLVAPCVVSRLHDDAGTVGTTAIDKQPVEGAVKVKRRGLYADIQADRKHRGGSSHPTGSLRRESAGRRARREQRPGDSIEVLPAPAGAPTILDIYQGV